MIWGIIMPSLALIHDFTFKMCTTNGTINLPFCYEVILEKPINRVTQAVDFLVSSDRDEAGIIIIRNREKRKKELLEELLHYDSARVFPPKNVALNRCIFRLYSRILKVFVHPTH